jgi:hypothetical protein
VPETPTWGLPYPEASTLITDSAAIVQTLAEKIDTALSQVTVADSYTVPGTLVQDFTTSGTYTPAPGVSTVHVAVIGGGAGGCYYSGSTYSGGSPGGSGGGVRIYRNVPVTGPVAVTIGGSNTGSSFGALTAPAGYRAPDGGAGVALAVWSPNCVATDTSTRRVSCPGYSVHTMQGWGSGYDGVQINGTYYAGGGGGGAVQNGGTRGLGGQGGGGHGVMFGGSTPPTNGANGLGGGGGGGSYTGTTLGGSGRVMIYTEQAYKSTRNVPAPIDPEIDAALNVAGVILGLVAVDPADPQAPGIPDATLVAYPDNPQPTGRMLTVPVDPDDPDGPTHEIPELAWPVAGWTHHDGTWTPPTTGEDTP